MHLFDFYKKNEGFVVLLYSNMFVVYFFLDYNL